MEIQKLNSEERKAIGWLNKGLRDLETMASLPPTTIENLLKYQIAVSAFLTQINIVADELTKEQIKAYFRKFNKINDEYTQKIPGEN